MLQGTNLVVKCKYKINTLILRISCKMEIVFNILVPPQPHDYLSNNTIQSSCVETKKCYVTFFVFSQKVVIWDAPPFVNKLMQQKLALMIVQKKFLMWVSSNMIFMMLQFYVILKQNTFMRFIFEKRLTINK